MPKTVSVFQRKFETAPREIGEQVRSMFLHDQASKLADARREGKEEGLQEGLIETAKQLLTSLAEQPAFHGKRWRV